MPDQEEKTAIERLRDWASHHSIILEPLEGRFYLAILELADRMDVMENEVGRGEWHKDTPPAVSERTNLVGAIYNLFHEYIRGNTFNREVVNNRLLRDMMLLVKEHDATKDAKNARLKKAIGETLKLMSYHWRYQDCNVAHSLLRAALSGDESEGNDE